MTYSPMPEAPLRAGRRAAPGQLREGIVSLKSVAVRRGDALLLRDIDWEVREGERWVILGPNGAGKTTLLQILGARMFPTSGQATLLQEQLGEVDVFDLRPRIGMASAALADNLPATERVEDVVLTAAYGVTGRWREAYDTIDHRRGADLLAAFGVLGLADRTFGTLSEGERKRVQLARSMMTDPEMLLLDEPAAGLDLGSRETLVSDLAEIAGDPRSPVLILVTHHVEEIPPGFDHALLMREGGVVACGPIEDVLTDANLSATFGVPLRVELVGDRWAARIQRVDHRAEHRADNHRDENHGSENHSSENNSSENHSSENHSSENHSSENHSSGQQPGGENG